MYIYNKQVGVKKGSRAIFYFCDFLRLFYRNHSLSVFSLRGLPRESATPKRLVSQNSEINKTQSD